MLYFFFHKFYQGMLLARKVPSEFFELRYAGKKKKAGISVSLALLRHGENKL